VRLGALSVAAVPKRDATSPESRERAYKNASTPSQAGIEDNSKKCVARPALAKIVDRCTRDRAHFYPLSSRLFPTVFAAQPNGPDNSKKRRPPGLGAPPQPIGNPERRRGLSDNTLP
jgi:hypothetical protein